MSKDYASSDDARSDDASSDDASNEDSEGPLPNFNERASSKPNTSVKKSLNDRVPKSWLQ